MATKKKGGASLLLVALALAAKSAKLLKFLQLFKVAKPLVLFVSMSVSAIAYAFWLGPWLSLVFVGLLLIHEMGHVAAMRMKGYATPTAVFIPFLGAAIFAPKFAERDTEAFVGYGGPLLGTIGSVAALALALMMPADSVAAHVLMVGSYLGMYLNLFNLLPISPLDGGRITQAAGRWFKYIGLIALAGFSMVFKEPVILYIWIIVLYDLSMIPVRLRAVLVTACWLAMVTLMILGFSSQPWWVDVIDCVLTIAFVVLVVAEAFGKVEETAPDNRPDLTPSARMRWFLLYLGLAAGLAATIWFQVSLLPQPPSP